MNEWGIPDWRDPAGYGDTASWNMNRWRWEFYRRRDDLRAYFDHWAEETHRNRLEANKDLEPQDPGFMAFGKGGQPREAIRNFGYAGVPNPRIGAQPSGAIIPFRWLARRTGRLRGSSPHVGGRSVLNAINDRTDKEFRVWLKPHEMTIRFDLNEPLQLQIEHAREALRAEQLKLQGKFLQTRRHPKKWLRYLRTLDASSAGASWGEIATLHPATAQTEQTVSNVLVQANTLRFNFRD